MTFKYFTGNTTWFSDEDALAGAPGDQGILSMILDQIAPSAKRHEENLGTGDGIDVTFSMTLANTPIALGQCGIKYKIGLLWYYSWANSDNNFVGHKISVGTINRTTGAITVTFTEPIATGDDIDVIYSTGDAGDDWLILLDEPSTDYATTALRQVVLRNSGVAGNDSVLIGFRERGTVLEDRGIQIRIFKDFAPTDAWNSGLSLTYTRAAYASKIYSSLPGVMVHNNSPNEYHIRSSKRSVCGFITTSATLDMSFYAGFLKRVVRDHEHVCPNFAMGVHAGIVAYSSTAPEIARDMWVIAPTGSYEQARSANIKTLPLLREQLKNTPGVDTVTLFPLYVRDEENFFPNSVLAGELEGIYRISGTYNTGDTIDIGTRKFIVFRNVYRTSWLDMYCLETE
jgi:hypothetical protein